MVKRQLSSTHRTEEPVVKNLVVIVGYGPVGRDTAHRLSQRGTPVRIAQRKRPGDMPAGAEFVPCDALDPASVRAAIEGAAQVVLSIGLVYSGKLWQSSWPKIMTNFVDACSESGARLVFFDNLYMYGPCKAPMKETNPLTSFGLKPAARSEATRIWMRASEAGRLRIAAVRAPDFYGPGVTLSIFGDYGFGALAKGQSATYLGSPDLPHDFAYVPDCGRAVVTLLDAPDDAFGRPWHVPCAPTRSAREILALGARALGVKPRIRAMPLWSLGLVGLFVLAVRDFREMSFNWDRPYHVDASDFAKRFWSDATPFEVGVVETAKAFRQAARM
jgi:nucleoside-diphosphate-sugar epimerase